MTRQSGDSASYWVSRGVSDPVAMVERGYDAIADRFEGWGEAEGEPRERFFAELTRRLSDGHACSKPAAAAGRRLLGWRAAWRGWVLKGAGAAVDDRVAAWEACAHEPHPCLHPSHGNTPRRNRVPARSIRRNLAHISTNPAIEIGSCQDDRCRPSARSWRPASHHRHALGSLRLAASSQAVEAISSRLRQCAAMFPRAVLGSFAH